MADGTTWRGRPISLAEFMEGGGALVATCGSPSCRAATVVAHDFVSKNASLSRLEDAIRCTCGFRGGRFHLWPGDTTATPEAHRCYLFCV